MTIEQEASFDKLFGDMQYIPIETGDNYLLGGRSAIKYIDNNNILIESGRELYRFGRNGKFINRIGKNGQGPNEYTYPGAVSVDTESKLLYLFNNKRFQVWTFEGEFIKTIAIDDSREPVMTTI